MSEEFPVIKVAVLATDNVYGGNLMTCRDILYGIKWRAERLPGPKLDFELISINGADVVTYSGATISCDGEMDDRAWDVIILPHLWMGINELAELHRQIGPWLEPYLRNRKLVLSMGCGVYWVAAAGYLNGSEATTYWRQHDDFAQLFPEVSWQKDKAITESDNIYCAAGGNSMGDLMLNLAIRLFGESVARGISRDILFDIRRSYDFAPLRMGSQRSHGDRLIEQVQAWLESRYSEEVRLADVAKNHGMSLRNFARRFSSATGEKPLAYLQRVRLEAARDLLVHSDKSIKHISLDVGYSDSSYFCRLFRTQIGQTPAAYRKQFSD
ncbi:helix-turn-helix domain-containing protein [Aestuariicella hydrocarbonica]|uniref:Helix-turn-helix domain-containing protein n=1 Tax=Pseudomaricurvus hydrocarbonicus TaxID=1470433 RepID=A0A9E5T2T7_9GAMM|nr:helix-turn-helix domain-containing protein [Aestuariicella hydrocarbonica]NHO68161.1 helix-turn-helix domain-containing protein [Aestuariicella hydrocarbonica]